MGGGERWELITDRRAAVTHEGVWKPGTSREPAGNLSHQSPTSAPGPACASVTVSNDAGGLTHIPHLTHTLTHTTGACVSPVRVLRCTSDVSQSSGNDIHSQRKSPDSFAPASMLTANLAKYAKHAKGTRGVADHLDVTFCEVV